MCQVKTTSWCLVFMPCRKGFCDQAKIANWRLIFVPNVASSSRNSSGSRRISEATSYNRDAMPCLPKAGVKAFRYEQNWQLPCNFARCHTSLCDPSYNWCLISGVSIYQKLILKKQPLKISQKFCAISNQVFY